MPGALKDGAQSEVALRPCSVTIELGLVGEAAFYKIAKQFYKWKQTGWNPSTKNNDRKKAPTKG